VYSSYLTWWTVSRARGRYLAARAYTESLARYCCVLEAHPRALHGDMEPCSLSSGPA